MKALDLNDPNSKREYDVYQKLVKEHQKIARLLEETAKEMAGYRDLPMGRHDHRKMSDPKVIEAFKKYTDIEQELLMMLNKRVGQDKKMIAEMRQSTGSDSV